MKGRQDNPHEDDRSVMRHADSPPRNPGKPSRRCFLGHVPRIHVRGRTLASDALRQPGPRQDLLEESRAVEPSDELARGRPGLRVPSRPLEAIDRETVEAPLGIDREP